MNHKQFVKKLVWVYNELIDGVNKPYLNVRPNFVKIGTQDRVVNITIWSDDSTTCEVRVPDVLGALSDEPFDNFTETVEFVRSELLGI